MADFKKQIGLLLECIFPFLPGNIEGKILRGCLGADAERFFIYHFKNIREEAWVL